MAVLYRTDEAQHHDDDLGKPSPEVGEDLAEVVAAAAEHGEECVAQGALEAAAGEAAVGLHVADLGLDGAAASERLRQGWRQAATGAADQDTCRFDAVAAVATV